MVTVSISSEMTLSSTLSPARGRMVSALPSGPGSSCLIV